MRTRLQLCGHPLFAGSVALLALNDHVLKGLWHPGLTGKLSDFAGLFVVALLTGIILNRVGPAILVVGVAFTAIKLFPVPAEIAAPLLGGPTRQDPMDLTALLVLWPAWHFLQRYDVPEGPRFTDIALNLGAGLVAILAVTATSCLDDPGVTGVWGDGSILYASISQPGESPDPQWTVSRDGGATWQGSSEPEGNLEEEVHVCAADATCFRVVPGERIEERRDGAGWTTAFAFSEEERKRLDLQSEDCGEKGLDEDAFQGVATTSIDGEVHVVVAMGTQGALHRGPDGSWERVEVLNVQPKPLWAPTWLVHLRWAPIFLALLAPLVFIVGLFTDRTRDGAYYAAQLFISGFVMFIASGLLVVFFFDGLDYPTFGPLLTVICGVVFALCLRGFIHKKRSRKAEAMQMATGERPPDDVRPAGSDTPLDL